LWRVDVDDHRRVGVGHDDSPSDNCSRWRRNDDDGRRIGYDRCRR
jgi:hypothetical protein